MAQNVFYRDFTMLKAAILSVAMIAAVALNSADPVQRETAVSDKSPRLVLIRAAMWIDGDCVKDAAAPVDL